MEYKILGNTGLKLSVIGFGASPLGDEFGTIDPAEGERAVHVAVDSGINFFDVSPYYGRGLAEQRVGAALAGRRGQVVLSTKCGRYDTELFDFSSSRVKTSVEESLSRLRTDHVDLIIAHDIEFADRGQIVQETLPAMRDMQQQGKVRFIGISGLPLKLLAGVARETSVDAVLSYCHYTLLTRDVDDWLTPVLRQRQIGLINASPLHMRILTAAAAPPWHPAPEPVKQAGAKVVALCRGRGVDPALVALRFCLDHPYVSSTLVGMSSVSEVEQNLQAREFRIEPGLLAEIDRTVAPIQNLTWPSGRPENRGA